MHMVSAMADKVARGGELSEEERLKVCESLTVLLAFLSLFSLSLMVVIIVHCDPSPLFLLLSTLQLMARRFMQAASYGHNGAKFELALCYEHGWGIAVNRENTVKVSSCIARLYLCIYVSVYIACVFVCVTNTFRYQQREQC
jgi:hypothetical protein